MAGTNIVFTKADIDKFAKELNGAIMDTSSDVFMPEKIIKSADRTIVFWKDGTKTIVRRSDDTADDLYSAFCAALAKKVYGSNSQVKKILRMADIQPMSDIMRKKEAEEYRRMLEARKAREEAERPQKILNEYIDKDPIQSELNTFRQELDSKIDKVVKALSNSHKKEN